MQIAGFAASPIGGHLSDKLGRKRVVMSSMLLSGVMIVCMAFAGKSAAFVFFIALVGFFLYAMRAGAAGVGRRVHAQGDGRQRRGDPVRDTAAGSAIAPAIFGMIADAYDLHTAFLFLAGTIIFANVLIMFMPNGEAKKPATAAA